VNSQGQEFPSTTVAFTNTILVSQTVGITSTAGCQGHVWKQLCGAAERGQRADTGGAGTIITALRSATIGTTLPLSTRWGNYHIGPTSAAIDRGVKVNVPADIDGDARPAAFGFDLGADERPGASYLFIRTHGRYSHPGRTVTYTIAITSAGTDAATNVRLTDTLPTCSRRSPSPRQKEAVPLDSWVGM